MCQFISRLFARKAAAPVRRTPARFRPRVDALEARDVPALFTWTGEFNQFADLSANWRDSDHPEWGPSWVLPGAGDDLLFAAGDIGGNTDCYGLQTFGGGPYRVVTVTGGYTSTITLKGLLDTQALTMEAGEGGAIDQNGFDIKVEGPDVDSGSIRAFTWDGGVLNSGATLANVNILGGTALIDPLGGMLLTGSNLNFTATNAAVDATVNEGTIRQYNAAGAVIGGLVFWNLPATVTMNGNVDTNGPAGNWLVNPLGTYTVSGGAVPRVNAHPTQVQGGKLVISGGATASFTGQLPNNGGSVTMDSGAIQITTGSVLKVTAGLAMSGGNLVVLPGFPTQTAKIDGSVADNGADIYLGYDVTPPTKEAPIVSVTLNVTGVVNWTAGDMHVSLDAGKDTCSNWTVDNDFTIGGTAIVKVDGFRPGQGDPTGKTFDVLVSKTVIVGGPNATPVGFEWLNQGDPVNKWVLRKT
jgi:hypothetical protein